MKTPKHTKGPWIVFDFGYGLGICPKHVLNGFTPSVDAINSAIVRFSIPASELKEFDHDFLRQKADALLMAAAPEMYQALENILKLCDPTGFDLLQLNNQLHEVQQILKKARGEQ